MTWHNICVGTKSDDGLDDDNSSRPGKNNKKKKRRRRRKIIIKPADTVSGDQGDKNDPKPTGMPSFLIKSLIIYHTLVSWAWSNHYTKFLPI